MKMLDEELVILAAALANAGDPDGRYVRHRAEGLADAATYAEF